MKVVALQGKSNTGKSETLKRLIQVVAEEKYAVHSFGLLPPKNKDDLSRILFDARECAKDATSYNGDVYAIFELNGTCVGISTQGDNRHWLETAFDIICKTMQETGLKRMPDIFVCAIRNYGETEDFVVDVCDDPPVIVYGRMSVDTIGQFENFVSVKQERERERNTGKGDVKILTTCNIVRELNRGNNQRL